MNEAIQIKWQRMCEIIENGMHRWTYSDLIINTQAHTIRTEFVVKELYAWKKRRNNNYYPCMHVDYYFNYHFINNLCSSDLRKRMKYIPISFVLFAWKEDWSVLACSLNVFQWNRQFGMEHFRLQFWNHSELSSSQIFHLF